MKIIKHGTLPKDLDVKYKLECDNCGCVFEFKSDEIESQERRIDGFAKIRCPECKMMIVFKPSANTMEAENE